MNMFVDVRHIGEITKSGQNLGAKHIPIVILEYWINSNNGYYKKFLSESFNFLFYYAQIGSNSCYSCNK